MLFELAPAPEHRKGDKLGRSYTPDHVAAAILARIVERGWPVAEVWEPCVGGGAFVRAARAAGARWISGTDVDYLTQTGWRDLVSTAAEVWPIIGRVWDHERGMVVLVWRRHAVGPALFEPLAVR